jgi:hypothetical protein
MEGYDVITSDDARFGHVVGTAGDNLIIEHGTLRKSRHALPRTFAHVDDTEQVIRTTLSRQLIEDSPKIGDNGDLDNEAIAAYYGLAAGDEGEPTEGDVMPAEQERAEVREHLEAGTTYGPPGRQILPPDPHTSSRPGDFEDR